MTGPRTPNEILEERARRLAKPAGGDVVAAFGVEMLAFSVGRERYAVESRYVFAVARLTDLVPLPGARIPVVGLTRWRGDVLTVLDLRRVVGGAPGALDDLGRVIVLGRTAPEFGVLADSATHIMTIDPSQLHAPPADRNTEATHLLRGVTGDAVHVLDAAALMARQADAHSAGDMLVSPSSSPVP